MATTWQQFNRFAHAAAFFAVVTKDGEWIDSAVSFQAAVQFACMYDGVEEVQETTSSIIHSSLLEVMWEAGLIK
jgi:hypothetical protein